jgi:hypothetical protein
MPVNKTVCPCEICQNPIPVNGGLAVIPHGFAHNACHLAGKAMVEAVRKEGDRVVEIQNVGGRCTDAPCCGCCGTV